MVHSSVLGFPRMGADRELKKANEAYWAGQLSRDELLKEGKRLRLEHWKIQKDAGVDVIPSNDFAFYDHLLDHIQLFNVIPERYAKASLHSLDEYFAMGRGHQKDGVDVPSLEMVKWFDSNYHYVKPTFQDGQTFKLSSEPKPVTEFLEAKEAGILTRPVLIGPVSFLALGKADRDQSVDPISLLDKLLPVYVELLEKLKAAGAEHVQIDEPVLVYDLPQKVKDAFKPAYEKLVGSNLPKAIVATYFGDVVHNIDVFSSLRNVLGIHVDLVRNPEQLETVISKLGSNQVLSAGVVDGRNIWKTNFKNAIELIETAVQKLGKDRVVVATSSSLLHTPHSLDSEKKLPAEVKDWFSFAVQKVSEVVVIAKAVNEGPAAVREALEANAKSMQARASSKRTNNKAVKERQASVTPEQHERKSAFPERYAQQKKHLNLPLFPTTTIGSFPQTKEIRISRNKFTKGEITAEQYEKFIEKEIEEVVKIQDELGLDVYVHALAKFSVIEQELLDHHRMASAAEVDLTKHPTAQQLLQRCQDFFSEVENLTPGKDLESYLNLHYGPGNPIYSDFCALILQGLDEGWVANVEITGPNYRRSKIALPKDETRFFSITTVYMNSQEEFSGQYHSHPYGEINCVVQIDKTAELKGMQGWQGAGWTSPGPGTHHYPQVRGGALVALFFLPAGRISYTAKMSDPQPALL